MSLLGDGKTAMAALVKETALFDRIKPADWSAAAVKLAKKQLISAGLTTADLIAIREAIGGSIFNKTLDDLTAFQMKLLAKRIDASVTQEQIASKSMALAIIRERLSEASETDAAIDVKTEDADPKTEQTKPASKVNPYIGRKAFRVR